MQSDIQKVIFLDRDGVLIRERGDYTWLLEDMHINDGVVEALQAYIKAGYLLIIISNQGGIGKGLYTKEEADFLHFHLCRFLAVKNIVITEIYYCPHHPSTSNCLCRKPLPLLLEKAIARFELDASKCFFIGDADRDIEAGIAAGVNVLKLEVNGNLLDLKLES